MPYSYTSSGRAWRGRYAAALVLALVLAALAIPALASSHKTFLAEVAPDAVLVGAGQRFDFLITNTSASTQIGSANITLPSGVTIASDDDVFDPTVDGQPQGTSALDRTKRVIELRDLSAPPNGAEISVGFEADIACSAEGGVFGVEAKQANNFRGPPGNDLAKDPAYQAPTLTVTCERLAFEYGEGEGLVSGQPSHAHAGKTITTASGDPIRVFVLGEDGKPKTGFSGSVAVEIGHDPSSGEATLVGTESDDAGGVVRDAVNGIATFDDLSIDVAGSGYTLEASAGLLSAESDSFNIWGTSQTDCSAGDSCTTTATIPGVMTVTVQGERKEEFEFGEDRLDLTILEGAELNCEDSNASHAPHPTLLDPGGAFVAPLRVSVLFHAASEPDSAIEYQVCYEGDEPFYDRDGDAVTTPGNGVFGPALLHDCPASRPGPGEGQDSIYPCVEGWLNHENGDREVRFLLPTQDPRFK